MKSTFLSCLFLCTIAFNLMVHAKVYFVETQNIYPDPENCHNYYLCGDPDHCTLCECDPGLLFDEDRLVCDWAENVDCDDRPNPYVTTQIPDFSSTTHMPTVTTNFPTLTTATTPTTLTTTTSSTTTQAVTTTHDDDHPRYPKRVLGMYLALADDGIPGYHTDDLWAPKLYEYQQLAFNVLYFAFINPSTMEIPNSFKSLAGTRGNGLRGSVPSSTKIIFAIGGYTYSLDPYNPWEWLTSKAKAESMAEIVASWPDEYGCDGIDLDIEEGAGEQEEAGPNLVHFIRKLRKLQPDIIIGQPTYGYPFVPAEIEVINESFDVDTSSNNLADSVGIMTYEGTASLYYIKNYAEATNQGEGFPITSNAPYSTILVGSKGTNSPTDIETLAKESLNQDLLGLMVWYSSVVGGFQYAKDWDTSYNTESQDAFISAMDIISNA